MNEHLTYEGLSQRFEPVELYLRKTKNKTAIELTTELDGLITLLATEIDLALGGERDRACKAVCPLCEQLVPIVEENGRWFHQDTMRVKCSANNIWNLPK